MDFEKLATDVQSFESTVKDIVTVKTALFDNVEEPSEESTEKSQFVTDFLNAPIGDKKDLIMRKAVATAMVIAKEKAGIKIPETALEIASIVDDVLTRTKVGYLVGQAILEPEEAVDTLVDAAESRVAACVDTAFDSGLVNKVVTEGLAKGISMIPYIGPVVAPFIEACKPIISSVISFVEKPIKAFIHAGIKTVANVAKTVAKKVIETGKNLLKSVARGILSLFE